jgi:hypothetical protein
VQVSGADQSGVSFGNGGMSSTDVWIETPVAAQLPLPPLWSDASSTDERSSEKNGWSTSTSTDASAGPLYHADPGVNIPGFGSSPAIASQLRRPDTTSALVGGSGGDTEDLDGLREWVGGQEAVPLPLAPLPSTTAPATTTTTQPATVVQEQHEVGPILFAPVLCRLLVTLSITKRGLLSRQWIFAERSKRDPLLHPSYFRNFNGMFFLTYGCADLWSINDLSTSTTIYLFCPAFSL